MSENNQIVELAQALADPLRWNILQQLLEKPASVSELVSLTGAAQSRVSNHLTLLRERRLVRATRDGRQIIYALCDAAVGQLVESLSVVAGSAPDRYQKSTQLITARTCYDHLAGRYGVALFDALLDQQAITAPDGARGDIGLGPQSEEIFCKLDLDLAEVRHQRRRFAFACPDWTERRPHLGGALGAAVWACLVARGWVAQQQGTRAILVTAEGQQQLHAVLGLNI